MNQRAGYAATFKDPYEGFTNSSIDAATLRPGAEVVGANIGKERRARMNRIQKTRGLTLKEQIIAALDAWFETVDAHDDEDIAEARRLMRLDA